MFTGIARPIPTLPELPLDPIIAVFIPTNSPFRLTKAPPEFPGFIDASVCIKFSYASIPKPDLPSALTIPEVTVCPIPKGFPIATTKSPTRSFSEFANFKDVRFFGVIFITAISDAGSAPIREALNSLPSCNLTFISFALAIT